MSGFIELPAAVIIDVLLDAYVPYTGASGNVTLGANTISNTGATGHADGASFSGGTVSGNGIDAYGTGNGYGGRFSGSPTAIYASGNISLTGQIYGAMDSYMAPAGTTQTIDWNNGNVQTLNLGSASGDVTITMTNSHAAGSYVLKVIQVYGGTVRNVIWGTPTVKWANASIPTISTGSGAIDIISFIYDGTYMYGSAIQNLS